MKIGILTEYYKSCNYGGNLQAYALCEVIKKYSFNCEQICYIVPKNRNKIVDFLAKIAKEVVFCLSNVKSLGSLIKSNKYIKKRKKSILKFNFSIPHSKNIYNKNNMTLANSDYYCFIVGSDQVWLPERLNSDYFLNFVHFDKYKFSYAASITDNNLSEEQIKKYVTFLKSFNAISVRESQSVELLNNKLEQTINWVLDPTLLLNKTEWDTICNDRIVSNEYVFCYFLGSDIQQRNAAWAFAKKKNLKLVNIPYLLGKYRECDKNFGDIILNDVSPNDFISLIKHSSYVFTDSFHATVFANIYQVQYFVFCRNGSNKMSSRIHSLTQLFETSERFLDTKEKICDNYLLSVPDIDYSKNLNEFETMKNNSINYLINNINKSKEKQ